MSKQKILIGIPLLIIAGFLVYCWTIILLTDTIATWRHYSGLILFCTLIGLIFKSLPKAVIGTGIFLLLATFNLLTLTTEIKTSWLSINLGSNKISTPPINLLSLGIFVIYLFLNIDNVINIELDYREAKERGRSNR